MGPETREHYEPDTMVCARICTVCRARLCNTHGEMGLGSRKLPGVTLSPMFASVNFPGDPLT